MVVFIGIDLAGSEKRNTGICVLKDNKVEVKIVKENREIFSVFHEVKREKGKKEIWTGIDAPLSLPKGRKDIDDREGEHFRKCDLELRKLGIKFFPITLGPMRALTKRGILIKSELEKERIKVFEVYPGATYDIFGIPRKSKEEITKFFMEFFRNEGIKFHIKRPLSQDEIDAIACAITVKLFYDGKAKEIGDKKEGTILIPKI